MKQNTFVIIDTKKESNILIKVTFMQKQVHCNLPKISENESNSLEGPLTKKKDLSFLKNDKSTGPDGVLLVNSFSGMIWVHFLHEPLTFQNESSIFQNPTNLV